MNRNKISIAVKTLDLLEKYSWEKISLSFLNKDQKKIFKNKTDLLINLNRYFDYLLKKNLSNIEESSRKDMLFEVLMARLDILNKYRKSIKKIINYFLYNPHKFLKILPTFSETIIYIATVSNFNINGVKGLPILKLIFILYFLIIFTWMNDETESLEKTMTILDKYLNNIDKFFKL